MTESSQLHNELLALTADIVSSHFANNSVAAGDVPGITDEKFQELAAKAKAECPVSQALGAINVTLDAKLA